MFGFSHTIPFDLAPPGLPLLLLLHAVIFGAWVLLFIVQASLVARRSIVMHRRLGWVGVGLACAMIILGCSAILLALWHKSLPPFYPPGLFIVRGIVGLVLFAGLLTAAIRLRRKPEWHKRLTLCAAMTVVVPGLERSLPLPLFGAAWPFVADGVLDLIALVGPAMDLSIRKRIHPAYVWGVGAIVAGQAVVDLVAPSPIAALMLRLVGAS
ncbi:hypothetical protein [Lichenicola sp.]|uniref:hypothetical protein n=1 Tax=Lichenicola sp. TaxID=2804529 RepID=UPI003B004956